MKRAVLAALLPFSVYSPLLTNACSDGDGSKTTIATGGAAGAGARAIGGSDLGEAGAGPGADGGASGGASSGAAGGAGGVAGAGAEGGTAGASEGAAAGAGGQGTCVPHTCEALNACGGQLDDGCSRVLQCPPCEPELCEFESALVLSRSAQSSGFRGTEQQYTELYGVRCNNLADCETACLARDGSTEMCAASECVQSEPDYCLPATTWRNLSALATTGEDPARDGAELVLVALPYHDELLAEGFQFELPPSAEILGIEVTLRRVADYASSAADNSVRLRRSGTSTKLDRAKPEQWPTGPFQGVTYGGKLDLWGEPWTTEELNSGALGVALSVRYTQEAGNARAYVDMIQAKAYYRAECE